VWREERGRREEGGKGGRRKKTETYLKTLM
jgi:hypothetical protein